MESESTFNEKTQLFSLPLYKPVEEKHIPESQL